MLLLMISRRFWVDYISVREYCILNGCFSADNSVLQVHWIGTAASRLFPCRNIADHLQCQLYSRPSLDLGMLAFLSKDALKADR
jgi:hypothetical protein